MFFYATEMDVELMEVLQQGAEGGALGHLGKGIHILGEALASIAVLAVGTGDVGVGVVDIARKQNAGVHLAPVGAHLLAILAGVEVGDLVGSEDIVHILGELGLKGSHDGKLLAHEYLGEQLVCTGEDHRLLLEVLDMGTLCQKLGHVAYLVAGLLGESIAGAREDGSAHEYWHIREFLDELCHETEVLRAVVLGGDMNLEESDIHLTQVVIIALRGVTDKKFAFRVVVFQPIFEGSAHEATSDNSNVDHITKI